MANRDRESEFVVPKQKGRALIFPPDDFKIMVPFGVGVSADECSFRVKGGGRSRIVVAQSRHNSTRAIRIHPTYSAIERMTLNKKSVKVEFWVVVSDVDRLRARQLIEREHYLMPTARGLFLVCGIKRDRERHRPKIIGVSVLDTLLHGNPKVGRSQFAARVFGSSEWLNWPRNKIVSRLRVAWASRFAVHSSYHGSGIGTRLASHLRTVARQFRLPSADFIEVITTEPRPPKIGGDQPTRKRNFLVRAGYTRMAQPLRSAPLRVLNLETGYMDSVSARKYYYYADIRDE